MALRKSVLVAPMGGGPTTPELVIAAARADSIGFLAAGYLTPAAMSERIEAVRAAGVAVAINLFAPSPMPVAPDALASYAAALRPEAERYGLELDARTPVEDDDGWHAKVELLLRSPVALASFTFALPEQGVIDALQAAGTRVAQTVTSLEEARAAARAGVDALVVQGSGAGGHSATFTPLRGAPEVELVGLIELIAEETALPLIATGGLSSAADVGAVLEAGATAAMVGTVLLRCEQSGASAVHRAALADHSRGETLVTHAFTGRPARALRNDFIARHDGEAPLGYPAVHHLTSPLRRAAAAAGDAENVHLWAGTGYRAATTEPLATILERLDPTR